MARGFIGTIIEFLIGFLLVPIVVGIISGVLTLLFPSLGVNNASQFAAYSLIGSYILSGIILIILYKIRRMIAIGYLASIILNIIGFSIYGLVKILLSNFKVA